jgi:hypothetical protein
MCGYNRTRPISALGSPELSCRVESREAELISDPWPKINCFGWSLSIMPDQSLRARRNDESQRRAHRTRRLSAIPRSLGSRDHSPASR